MKNSYMIDRNFEIIKYNKNQTTNTRSKLNKIISFTIVKIKKIDIELKIFRRLCLFYFFIISILSFSFLILFYFYLR